MNPVPCAHCRKLFLPDPRVKNQHYCSQKACQRARKTVWQRQKMADDSEYQGNQKDAWKTWSQQHPDYWKAYRSRHPEYVEQNRLNQRVRDKKRCLGHLAKMDAFKPVSFVHPGTYFLIPHLAKMDASAQKIFIIPVGYPQQGSLAKKDSIDFVSSFS